MSEKPTTVIDPVCGMTVDVARAEAAKLTVEYEGRTYAFCRAGCRRAFLEETHLYTAESETVAPAVARGTLAVLPVIDEGMRRWYESCSCCLSDTYPEIKAQLDAERAAAAQSPVDPGICEVAEAATPEGAHA